MHGACGRLGSERTGIRCRDWHEGIRVLFFECRIQYINMKIISEIMLIVYVQLHVAMISRNGQELGANRDRSRLSYYKYLRNMPAPGSLGCIRAEGFRFRVSGLKLRTLNRPV